MKDIRGRGLYLSLSMGRLMGEQLRETLRELRHQKRRARAALLAAEKDLSSCKSWMTELRKLERI
jgi:hypothetical protein